MAEVLRGKHKGKRVTPHQWCNDWFMVHEMSNIFSPTSLKLDAGEVALVRASAEAGHAGVMLQEYELRDDGTFRKR